MGRDAESETIYAKEILLKKMECGRELEAEFGEMGGYEAESDAGSLLK